MARGYAVVTELIRDPAIYLSYVGNILGGLKLPVVIPWIGSLSDRLVHMVDFSRGVRHEAI